MLLSVDIEDATRSASVLSHQDMFFSEFCVSTGQDLLFSEFCGR